MNPRPQRYAEKPEPCPRRPEAICYVHPEDRECDKCHVASASSSDSFEQRRLAWEERMQATIDRIDQIERKEVSDAAEDS